MRFNDTQREQETSVAKRIYIASNEYLKIIWKNKTVDAFLTFLVDIRDFQNRHKQQVDCSYNLVDSSIRSHLGTKLKNHFPYKYDNDTVHGADIYDIATAAKIILVPEDLDAFANSLYDSCARYAVEQKGVSCQLTQENLLILRSKFMERYEFLMF